MSCLVSFLRMSSLPPSHTSILFCALHTFPLAHRCSIRQGAPLACATAEEVRLERPSSSRSLNQLRTTPSASSSSTRKAALEDEEERVQPKEGRVLGIPDEQPIQWLQRQNSASDKRRVPSKALQTLGVTIDDVRIEKALLVLGEAPGREVPAGKLPRPRSPPDEHEDVPPGTWAVAPPQPWRAGAGAERWTSSVFLWAFLPWGILAPLNVLKLQLNKVSPGAHLWVPTETEVCQAACGIARMWATLFWAMQFANAIGCLYLHAHRERGLAMQLLSHKIVVGGLLLKAYVSGVIFWPIGLVGACVEWMLPSSSSRSFANGDSLAAVDATRTPQ